MRQKKWQRPGNPASLTFTEMGFGTAPLGNLYKPLSEREARATLDAAWSVGCRYFDTAPLYGLGLAETRLNHFFRDHERDDFILSTKVGRYLQPCPPDERTGIGKFFQTPTRREVYDYGYDGVMRSLEHSFERLGVDRIDILYCHDIDVANHGSEEARDKKVEEFMTGGYQALLDLRSSGAISAIGAGINEWQVAQTLAERGDMDLFLLAGRYTLLEQGSLASFLPLCEQKGIGITLGGPYNSGILATGAKPGAWYNYEPAPQDILDRVAKIEEICSAHGVSLAEAALRFPLGHPAVVSVIPGGQAPAEVEANARNLEVTIPDGLWSDLRAAGLLAESAPTPRSRPEEAQ
jgi:D-threo-aldose 1-dehydrogenase